jgi:hypothetical protein
MWERLRRFHSEWEERANELVMRPGMKRDANLAVAFQFALVEAIGGAQAWLLTDEQITALENLTLGGEALALGLARRNICQLHRTTNDD